jgi:acyl-CoA reductase-like NAD-dependent aldehyde dehydrogenase
MKIPREIFGPVLPIVPVESVDEGITFVNAKLESTFFFVFRWTHSSLV